MHHEHFFRALSATEADMIDVFEPCRSVWVVSDESPNGFCWRVTCDLFCASVLPYSVRLPSHRCGGSTCHLDGRVRHAHEDRDTRGTVKWGRISLVISVRKATVTVLSRRSSSALPAGAPCRMLFWDGVTEGAGKSALERADVCINLAGRRLPLPRKKQESDLRIPDSIDSALEPGYCFARRTAWSVAQRQHRHHLPAMPSTRTWMKQREN